MSDLRGVGIDRDQALRHEGREHARVIAGARLLNGDAAPDGYAVGDLDKTKEESAGVAALFGRKLAEGGFGGAGDRVADAAAFLVRGDGEQPATQPLPGREQCIG